MSRTEIQPKLVKKFQCYLPGLLVSWALVRRNQNLKLEKAGVSFGPVEDHHQTLNPFVDRVGLLNKDTLPSSKKEKKRN
jgi:hypothetical protein